MQRAIKKTRMTYRFLYGALCGVACLGITPLAQAHDLPHHKRHASGIHKRHLLRTVRPTNASPTLSIAAPEGTLIAQALPSQIDTIPIHEWDGQTETLKNASYAAPPLFAATLIDGTQLENGCLQHWLRSLDAPASCGIPAGNSTLALAWYRSRLSAAPNWQDFWDIARQPGRRGLHFGARTTLEISLMADGVEPENVYAVLSTPAGIERAFHRLDLLRPYIIWWRTPDDARQIMQQSSALMTSAPLAEVAAAAASMHLRSHATNSIFSAQTEHCLVTSLFWAVPQNVPNATAEKLIDALKNTRVVYQDHSNSEAPVNQSSLNVDDVFWQKNSPALEKRFLDWFNGNTAR